MKVLLHYEDNGDTELWKSLKITLPKSWKNGPTSKLLGQFVESYNANEAFGSKNPLKEQEMHLAIRVHQDEEENSQLQPLASDAIVLDVIADRADVYVVHGSSESLKDMANTRKATENQHKQSETTVQCTRFGCQKRFPPGGPYPEPCIFHKSPPVFHETAKYWACCPNKKAYDWDDFQKIPGCQTAECCTDIKEEDGRKLFLGGSDLREQVNPTKLKSIDDFNKAQAAGGSDAAPVLDRLQGVLQELGVECELYQQVVEGMKKELASQWVNEAELLEAVKAELGAKLKACLKAVAAEQLRIK